MISNLIKHALDIVEGLFKHWEIWIFVLLAVLSGVLFLRLPNLWALFLSLWWLWLFLIFFPILHSLWLFWRQSIFKNDIKWVLLELRMPREITQTPQAMEQVLRALHALRNSAGDIKEKYWDGEVTYWFALEVVSFGGEVHFYVRMRHKLRNLVEAAFFSYYKDVEVVEVDDYLDKLPGTVAEMYQNNLEMWGSEMLLNREDAYPIKSYFEFEEEEVSEKKKVLIDPMSNFLEILGKLKKEEIVGIQILIAPADPKWAAAWKELVDKLKEPKIKEHAKTNAEGEMLSFGKLIMRSPGETDVLEAVEKNLSKPGFDTLLRFIYLSPKDMFFDSFARRGLTGAFNQYGISNMNSFRQNYAISTRTRIWNWPHLFPKARNEYRKQRLLSNYRKREVPPETWMGRLITSYILNWNFASQRFQMNVEGLATLYHPPTAVVLTAPHVKRVESRKASPPAGLAIFGEEEEIEKYI